MRDKRQYSAAAFCALGVIAIGLTGCGNQQPAGKSKDQMAAFAGDPSKMPADVRARIAAAQNPAVAQKRATEMQNEAAAKNTGAAKQ